MLNVLLNNYDIDIYIYYFSYLASDSSVFLILNNSAESFGLTGIEFSNSSVNCRNSSSCL